MQPAKAKIHWVQVCSYPAYNKIDTHTHEFFHYIYIIRGSGEILLGENLYTMTPRHIYLVAPGKGHTFWNSGEEKLVTCEIKFDFFDVGMVNKMAELAECIDVSDAPILGILQNIRREHTRRKPYGSDIISMNLQEIYIHLQRGQQAFEEKAETAEREDLADVIEYIENNLEHDINLQDLANIVFMEKTHFLKKFKQLTGLTPMAYTRNARIKKAKELLKYSDMNVTQIAEAVGFQSIHYFSRYFASATGISPSKYKKEHPIP